MFRSTFLDSEQPSQSESEIRLALSLPVFVKLAEKRQNFGNALNLAVPPASVFDDLFCNLNRYNVLSNISGL